MSLSVDFACGGDQKFSGPDEAPKFVEADHERAVVGEQWRAHARGLAPAVPVMPPCRPRNRACARRSTASLWSCPRDRSPSSLQHNASLAAIAARTALPAATWLKLTSSGFVGLAANELGGLEVCAGVRSPRAGVIGSARPAAGSATHMPHPGVG